ncbi:colicin V production CvpA [Brevirhabdus pacifica]|uniref:Colicin V production CvpA n=1 Tax=Brevirhabdus pacifica TaxID=1267768 RepID=A0A1U7DL04_9RHOB|nr:CvpA family protein [Brevirhabdus pacifica]APX90652.1 colicin V production CvpA [Brevirhabdus pacifica]OWU78360.1 colicin V production CvpA [Loktanella sp. 22II-4b]PJJ85203.1 membrane protein required for colicin V production [Brevirhabdus pacifica]
MDGFTVVDAVVGFVIVVSALLAYSRGFVREVMSILGWIAAAILAFLFAAQAEPLVKELPYVGDFLTDSCELSTIAAFAAVFALALVVVSLFTPLFSGVVRRSALGGFDQGLGFVFGALRGIVLVAVAFLVYDRVVVDQSIPVIDNSRSAGVFSRVEENVERQVPTDLPGWITARYEDLVGQCTPTETR